MPISREEIVAEIQKFVAANDGKIPGESTFVSATRIKQSVWKGRYWVRWTDAVREAGYDPNSMKRKIPDEEILACLAKFITELGYFPVLDEIKLHARKTSGSPAWATIQKRYGGMPETAAALLKFSRQTEDTVLENLCKARLERESLKPVPASSGQHNKVAKVGFVYLKYSPSLRLYKIGKANHPNKRGAGISLLLPEDLLPKHEIRTDCPFILEKYWGNRFRDKKKQGEWYDLNSSDVEAFKKRREFIFSEFFP
ncbi:MAG: GIY-YIG nuclease family protein [Pirellulales bacterium]